MIPRLFALAAIIAVCAFLEPRRSPVRVAEAESPRSAQVAIEAGGGEIPQAPPSIARQGRSDATGPGPLDSGATPNRPAPPPSAKKRGRPEAARAVRRKHNPRHARGQGPRKR